MKKICLILAFVLLLTGCSAKNSVEPKLKGISFVAEISYYNEIYSCDCIMSEEGELTAKIKIPETLEGFTLKVNSDGVMAEYLGITYTPTDSNMPFSGVIEEFYQKLCIAKDIKEVKKKDNSYSISFGEGATKALLRITEAGLPISMEIPDERFKVDFYKVTII